MAKRPKSLLKGIVLELSEEIGSKFECLSTAISQISDFELSEIEAVSRAAFLVTFCAATKSYREAEP